MANAQAGRNLDILELARLVVPIRQDQGGTGATTAKQGLTNLIVNAAGVPFKDTDYSGTLKQDTLTANRTWTLPDVAGTVALISDVTAAGRVLQMVHAEYTSNTTCSTIIPLDNTIPQNTEGDELVTCSITPRSTTSKLLVEVVTPNSQINTGTVAIGAIFRDSDANAVGAALVAGTTGGNPQMNMKVRAFVASGSLAETTFKFRLGPSTTGSVTVNGNQSTPLLGGVMSVNMTVTEIAA